MLTELHVPREFTRNHASMRKFGVIRSGKLLIEKTIALCGLESLADKRVLDIGCGTRFTETLINRKKLSIKSYTGVDVDKSVIDYLKANVEAHDERFDYAHWDVVNALYNKKGGAFDGQSSLPLGPNRKFDLIWMFSVITHQYPEGSAALFKILRNYANPDGRMFFTAFIDSHVDKFKDIKEDQPLMYAYYQREYLLEILQECGWKVEKTLPPDTEYDPPLHQDCFLCSLR